LDGTWGTEITPGGREGAGFFILARAFPFVLFSVDFRFFLDMFTACGASEFLRKNAEDTRLCLPRSIVLFFF